MRERRKQHLDAVVVLVRLIRSLDPTKADSFKKDLDEKIFADSAPFAGAARCVLRDPDAFGI